MTCFDFQRFEHSVRASRDKSLQEIQAITRLNPQEFDNDKITEFWRLIETNCTFKKDWNDSELTPDKLRLFGEKKATKIAETKILNQMKINHGHQFLSRVACDYESTLEGNFTDATRSTIKLLNLKVKEPEKLFFYPLDIYEITFNK